MQFSKHFYIKVMVIIITTFLITNSLLSSRLPFIKNKLVTSKEKFFSFLFIGSCTLFQRHVEFNRLPSVNFLTCYSCSYYSFMHKGILLFLFSIRFSFVQTKNKDRIQRRSKFLNQLIQTLSQWSGTEKYLCVFVYSKSRSSLNPWLFQQTFIKEFPVVFFLIVFHAKRWYSSLAKK